MAPIKDPGKLVKPPAGCNETGIAVDGLTTRSPLRSPSRSRTAATPGNIPPFGEDTTVVNPAERQVSMRLSARLTSSAALRQGVVPGRASGPREVGGCGREPPSPPDGAGAGTMPTSVKASIKPGYTVRPLPSTTQASSGTGASLAMVLMTPRAMMTVAFSTRGPETGTTVTPRMATYCGSPPCAASRGARASAKARMKAALQTNQTVRLKKERIAHSFIGLPSEAKITERRSSRRKRLVGSYRGVKQ